MLFEILVDYPRLSPRQFFFLFSRRNKIDRKEKPRKRSISRRAEEEGDEVESAWPLTPPGYPCMLEEYRSLINIIRSRILLSTSLIFLLFS